MEKKSNSIVTVLLIVILIFVRVVCSAIPEIVYIVFFINIVGLVYVIWQILASTYKEVASGVKPNSINQIIADRNKTLKRRFYVCVVVIIVLAIVGGIVTWKCDGEVCLGIVNDVIALISLGLSIEDQVICDHLIEICKR